MTAFKHVNYWSAAAVKLLAPTCQGLKEAAALFLNERHKCAMKIDEGIQAAEAAQTQSGDIKCNKAKIGVSGGRQWSKAWVRLRKKNHYGTKATRIQNAPGSSQVTAIMPIAYLVWYKIKMYSRKVGDGRRSYTRFSPEVCVLFENNHRLRLLFVPKLTRVRH